MWKKWKKNKKLCNRNLIFFFSFNDFVEEAINLNKQTDTQNKQNTQTNQDDISEI